MNLDYHRIRSNSGLAASPQRFGCRLLNLNKLSVDHGRSEKGARGRSSAHLSACSLITRYIYICNIYIYITRFVATDNRPRHSRPGNLNFENGHTVLARILSVYRFHTHTSPWLFPSSNALLRPLEILLSTSSKRFSQCPVVYTRTINSISFIALMAANSIIIQTDYVLKYLARRGPDTGRFLACF